jgi:hypothetical protein
VRPPETSTPVQKSYQSVPDGRYTERRAVPGFVTGLTSSAGPNRNWSATASARGSLAKSMTSGRRIVAFFRVTSAASVYV